MAEPATGELQQANSPARQLLAALTRASQDMERSVNDTYESVAKLNADFERIVGSQLDESNEKVEQYVRGHLENISTEKDSILAQLTEMRQEELKILQKTGKELREALVNSLNSLVNEFKTAVDESLRLFQDGLSATESENSSNLETTRQTLKEHIPGFLEAVREQASNEKTALEDLHAGYQKRLADESNVSLNELLEHCAELKGHLETEGENFLEAVDKRAESLIAEQTERVKQRTDAFSQSEQTASERINSLTATDISYIKELAPSFEQSCKEMAELQVGLHATVVKNLALQYRTEILSAAQEAEDHLQIVRADLQSQLRQYQNHYSEAFENLLSKFEKSAADLSHSQSSSLDHPDNNEQILQAVQEQFGSIKKIVVESAREKISGTELSMEKTYEDFRLRLENSRRAASEKVEQNFKESQDELSKLQQSSEEQLNEMNQKLEELEQSVAEAKDLIKALDQASLDF
ncbi:MAG: hypothetical protein K2X81_17540 [Candidatus Obscuribacterales bacterium]|nr:hypothetical protein [Candidatus Obscuribacterales bacterium]